MIDHEILFISGDAQHKFASSLLRKEKFLESAEAIKLLSELGERQRVEKKDLESYIVTIQDGVGLVNISGALTNDDCSYNRYYDLLSYDEIIRAISDLVNHDVKAALFNFDTPGGEGGKMIDVADMISNLPFPTVAHTSTSMCSAGYFVGCQADHVYSNEMASVGSVGVYLKVGDFSQMYSSMGITFERFRSGDLKATGDPAFKLTDKEKKFLKDRVANLADKFYSIVSSARGIPIELLMKSEIPSGRTFSGREAVANYLVDGIQSYEKSCMKVVQLANESVDNVNQYRLT